MERYCQSDSTVAYGFQREKDRDSDIERFVDGQNHFETHIFGLNFVFSIGSDSVFADGSLAGNGSLVECGTDDSRLNTSDLADFRTLSTYSKASESTNDIETSICEGGRVEVIPEKDASILLSDKTDLVETSLKDTISPKRTKSEGDDLFEGNYWGTKFNLKSVGQLYSDEDSSCYDRLQNF